MIIDLTPHGEVMRACESVFRDFEAGMTPPVPVELGDGNYMLRLPKQDAQHALLLKLAMVVSGVNAAAVLLRHGFFFEQAALQRMIDEGNEDVLFLTIGLTDDELTPMHQEFLANFWAEEFEDFEHTTDSHKSRPQVSRKKIHAYNARFHGDPSSTNKVAKVIQKTYSGFVHGAAPHIMELYDPDAKQFAVRGMPGSYKTEDSAHDIWNVVYRTGLSFIFASKALGSQAHADHMLEVLKRFQVATGREGGV